MISADILIIRCIITCSHGALLSGPFRPLHAIRMSPAQPAGASPFTIPGPAQPRLLRGAGNVLAAPTFRPCDGAAVTRTT